MAVTLPSAFVPFPVYHLGTNREVKAGANASHRGGADLARNLAYLYGDGFRPQTVLNEWNVAGAGYVAGNATAVIHGMWTIAPPPEPFTDYTVVALYQNTGNTTPGDDGTIRLDLSSDPWVSGGSPGTSVDLVALGGPTAQWGVATGTLGLDSSQAVDTIRAWVINGATGSVRLHSLALYPKAITSIPAGKVTVNGLDHVPFDDAQLAAEAPWTVHLANQLWANAEFIRRTRVDTLVSYSDNPQRASSAGYSETGADYTLVARVPFRARKGQTSIRWALHGRYLGTDGAVKLTTRYMDAQEDAAEEVDLNAGWSSPYTSNLHVYTDGGQAALSCAEDKAGELLVYLKGDGTSAALLFTLCAWFGPAA